MWTPIGKKTWSAKLAEAASMHVGYQEMAAKGLMTLEKLGTRPRELEDTGAIAEWELQALRGHRNRIERLERGRDNLKILLRCSANGA